MHYTRSSDSPFVPRINIYTTGFEVGHIMDFITARDTFLQSRLHPLTHSGKDTCFHNLFMGQTAVIHNFAADAHVH